MGGDLLIPQIKHNSDYNKTPLSKIIIGLGGLEKASLDYLFKHYSKIINLGVQDDIIKGLSITEFWEDGFFDVAGYLKYPLSFYLEFLPSTFNSDIFPVETEAGIYRLHYRILKAMDEKSMPFEEV